MADLYRNFAELAAANAEGRDFEITARDRRLTSGLLVMAPHGGSIEPGTTPLASELADELGASFYSFRGIGSGGFARLHLTSANFDEPRALELVRAHRVACAVHGCYEIHEVAYVGGLRARAALLAAERLRAMGIPCPEGAENRFPAKDPANICNRAPGGGVQVELSMGVRDRLRKDSGYRRQLVLALAQALREEADSGVTTAAPRV